MAVVVTTGAALKCLCGQAPSTLQVTSQNKMLADGLPAATIQDVQTGMNIKPFGMCTSMRNPQVAAATAAALGVLTPQPCQFMAQGTWKPTQTSVVTGGVAVLCNDSQLTCAMGGGVISITSPGQKKVIIETNH